MLDRAELRLSKPMLSDMCFYIAAVNMAIFLITFSFTVIGLIAEHDFYVEPFVISIVTLVVGKVCWKLGTKYQKRLTK
jgi:energy-converting hydrogenase Eha subunit H